MRIRKATVEDEKHILNLLKQFPLESEDYDWQRGAGTFRSIIKNSEFGSVFVADEDENILGVITLSYPTAIRCGGKYSCIEEFIVDEKGRGKGIGGQLIKNAIEEARSRGCYEIQVNRPSESGYPVYMSHGWKDLGKHLNLVFHKKH
ncbi:MAG: GNAT family N-acetyltransferase [Deltaproteobacteria bacterium]|nr:GNAT family N-acetyltransferase [Deltaproteobacteria bacterium]